jgi:BMFP domain-containing protein YqiC
MSDGPGKLQLDQLAKQLADAVPRNLRALGEDLEKNFRSLLQSGFDRMDLVTREEFDLQAAVLERTREKLDRIEQRLSALEQASGSSD